VCESPLKNLHKYICKCAGQLIDKWRACKGTYLSISDIFTNAWFSHFKMSIYHVSPPYTTDTHHIQFTMYISRLSCFSLSCTLKRGSFRYSFLCVCMCFVNCLQNRHASKDEASQPVWTSPKVSTSFCFRPRKKIKKIKKTILVAFDIQTAGMRAAYVCVHEVLSDLKDLELSQVDLEMDNHHQGERAAHPPPAVLDLTLC